MAPAERGLPEGQVDYELVEEGTGEPRAILDLAWPDGLQKGLSQKVTVLINEPQAVLDIANARGFRYFTTAEEFRRYVEEEVLTVAR